MLSRFIHNQLLDIRHQLPLLKKRAKWPKEWLTVTYKDYPRFKLLSLPEPEILTGALVTALTDRNSERDFDERWPIDQQSLANLLHYSAGVNDEHAAYRHISGWERETNRTKTRRFYPSAGARYPLEVYVVAHRVEGIPKGVYHYNVLKHGLEELVKMEDTRQVAHLLREKDAKQASVSILISAIRLRNAMKYGDFGYPAILMEAGHLTQNMHLVASSLGLSVCPYYGFNYKALGKLLKLDADELLLYATDLGKVSS